MAYVNKEQMKAVRAGIKKEFGKDYKFSVVCRHYSSIDVSLMEGTEDLKETYQQLNQFYPKNYNEYLQDVVNRVNKVILDVCGNSTGEDHDPMTDYFANNYYQSIQVGKWNRPYKVKGSK
jgi:hypothetical protein